MNHTLLLLATGARAVRARIRSAVTSVLGYAGSLLTNARAATGDRSRSSALAPELLGFLALLAVANLHLLGLADPWAWTFLPASVVAGEWWRLLTHPFLHVSAYHLALDGAAFLLLYTGLREPSRARRLGYVLAAAVGSLLVSLWAAPVVWTIGLCGLSGIAHGLMVVTALEMIVGSLRLPLRLAGWLCFVGVVGKCALEIALGGALIAAWHLGSVGFPVVVCHAGGVLGALVAWLVFARASPAPENR